MDILSGAGKVSWVVGDQVRIGEMLALDRCRLEFIAKAYAQGVHAFVRAR